MRLEDGAPGGFERLQCVRSLDFSAAVLGMQNERHNPGALITVPPLPLSFYARDVLDVARELLGKVLIHESDDGPVAVRLVETEAYRGPDDRAAHSYGGRRTRRNESMWGPAGHCYVYLCYGIHWCLNVVTKEQGVPQAVLVRAGEVIEGQEIMERRRGRKVPRAALARGPGCLTKALGVTGALDGASLLVGTMRIIDAPEVPESEVGVSPRIGIGYAGEHTELPWRFFVAGSASVSGPARLRAPRSD